MSVCIVGVGEPFAGDDAAGIRVIERLRAEPALAAVDLYALRDPSELAALLAGRDRALVVDARLGPEQVGRVDCFELEPGHAPVGRAGRSLSSHGVDTLTAIELARALAGDDRFPVVSLLTIAIARPDRLESGLSARVSDAVEEAARRALAWAEAATHA